MFSPAVLSIALPVHNADRWIAHALETILGQGFQSLQVLVADSGSSDRTQAVVRRYARVDSRVQYLDLTSTDGVFGRHDELLGASVGRYFKWASCSDVGVDGFFARATAVLDARPDVVGVFLRPGTLLHGIGSAWDSEDDALVDAARPSIRRQRYLGRVRHDNAFDGIVRRKSIADLTLNTVHPSELDITAELATRGKLVELPDDLLIVRQQPLPTTSATGSTTIPRLRRLQQTAARGVIRAIRRSV
jgi:glycosyltransferase involved in cell wall biosynthesis